MAFQAYPYNGQLRPNEIFATVYNMVIDQMTFADNFAHNYNIVDKFKVDGSLYGDTKLFYAAKPLKSYDWTNDAQAPNLLSLARPDAPACQAVTISNFRQIALTTDNWLSKRAWGSEGAFSGFTTVMLGMIGDTKRMYEVRKFNTYIGGAQTSVGKQTQTVPVSTETAGLTGDEKNRVYASTVAGAIADIFSELKDYRYDYNDLGYLRSYNPEDLMVIWNSKKKNKIKKASLPTMFKSEGLIDKFNEEEMPQEYFNIPLTTTNYTSYSAASATTGKPLAGSGTTYVYTPGTGNANGKIITLVEADYTGGSGAVHCYPGDEIPAGTTVTATSAGLRTTANEGHPAEDKLAIVDNTVICKIVHKKGIPFMAGVSIGTDFFNERSLTDTHFLTWGHSDLTYLKNYPFITVKEG